jgi:hypothetical protein
MKILAISKLTPNTTMDKVVPHLQKEARHVWEMYKSGVAREVYMAADNSKAVLVLECPSADEAQKALGELPLVKAGLLTFDVTVLVPFAGWGTLMSQ